MFTCMFVLLRIKLLFLSFLVFVDVRCIFHGFTTSLNIAEETTSYELTASTIWHVEVVLKSTWRVNKYNYSVIKLLYVKNHASSNSYCILSA